jgi:hypothetical protein
MPTKQDYITAISKKAMKSQLASFRIEGISITQKRAEQIRREVLAEMTNLAQSTR